MKVKGLENVKFNLQKFGKDELAKVFALLEDLLKIDCSLISNINEDLDKQVIVESIVRIAKYKKIKVLAEMVEKEEEYKVLKELGVDYLQGYFFGRPSPTLLN
ncbi:MAG: EAL domain-containing protein [Sulfurihydrogenibium sp.]